MYSFSSPGKNRVFLNFREVIIRKIHFRTKLQKLKDNLKKSKASSPIWMGHYKTYYSFLGNVGKWYMTQFYRNSSLWLPS